MSLRSGTLIGPDAAVVEEQAIYLVIKFLAVFRRRVELRRGCRRSKLPVIADEVAPDESRSSWLGYNTVGVLGVSWDTAGATHGIHNLAVSTEIMNSFTAEVANREPVSWGPLHDEATAWLRNIAWSILRLDRSRTRDWATGISREATLMAVADTHGRVDWLADDT